MWSTDPRALIPTGADLMAMIAKAEAKCDASIKASRQDRFEAAIRANRHGARDRHDAYCNQMPRARGFKA